VNQKYVLSDGVRTLDLYPMPGLNHAATMLIAYFPKERILVNADLYSPSCRLWEDRQTETQRHKKNLAANYANYANGRIKESLMRPFA